LLLCPASFRGRGVLSTVSANTFPTALTLESSVNGADSTSSAWLVACLIGLGAFSTYILLTPARSIALVLDIPTTFKLELLIVAAVNIALCFGFERYMERPIARLVAQTKRAIRRRRGKRHEPGHAYKVIEGNMQ
jgi:cation-transporting ATPase 13A2